VQSRNLVRRHLAKEKIYAIRLLANEKFPELVAPLVKVKQEARQRKAQARNMPRGSKALWGAQGPNRTADAIGVMLGISGTTVKRVDRLARVAPELVSRVAAGELSVKRALRDVALRTAERTPRLAKADSGSPGFSLEPAIGRLQNVLRAEWAKWPSRHRALFLEALDRVHHVLSDEHDGSGSPFHRAAG
jgi:hypothetical protein